MRTAVMVAVAANISNKKVKTSLKPEEYLEEVLNKAN